jgi:hypothetical protein
VYAGPLRDGRRTLLICANTLEAPGEIVRVKRKGVCRNYRRRLVRTRRSPAEPPAEVRAAFGSSDEVRYIPLTKGKYAIVDAADYEWLSRYRWQALGTPSGCFYASRAIPGRGRISMHRAIMNPPPGMLVDHINGNGLDDRRANLRICTPAQNCANRRPQSGRASPYKGVSPIGNGKYSAQIGYQGKIIWLGTFEDEIEAAKAYDRKAYELNGEFAYLNFPDEIRDAHV